MRQSRKALAPPGTPVGASLLTSFITAPIDEEQTCMGCAESSEEVDDNEANFEVWQSNSSGGTLICTVEARLALGDFSQTCDSSTDSCSEATCGLKYTVEIRSSGLSCNNVFINLDEQSTSGGGWQALCPDKDAGDYDDPPAGGGTWFPAFEGRAGTGCGEYKSKTIQVTANLGAVGTPLHYVGASPDKELKFHFSCNHCLSPYSAPSTGEPGGGGGE